MLRSLVTCAVALSFWTFTRTALAVVYPCTEAGLDAALKNGGLATFSCAAPTTITVGQTKTIGVSGTTLDGGGNLALSGGDARRIFDVAAGVTATIQNLTIEKGKSDLYGANLAVFGDLTLARSTVRGGTDGVGGAVLVETGGSLTATASAFTNNTSGAEGTLAVHGTATLTNVTLSDNSGRGVVARFGGTVALDHCTIVTTTGEALFAVGKDVISFGHTLVVAAPGTPSFGGAGTFTSTGYNMISDASVGTISGTTTGNRLNEVPLLGPLASNGGPTQTRALLACSPGINGGATSGGPTEDQRGNPRAANGARDIGAYESPLTPCVKVDSASGAEGDTGSQVLSFMVSLSGVSTVPITVDAATSNGTATIADGDYTPVATSLTFAPGTRSLKIDVPVQGDRKREPNETFSLTLSSPTNATLTGGPATGTITNDDATPAIAISSATLAEGSGGTVTVNLKASLSSASSEAITVQWTTADGSATAPGDYTAASGTTTFPPGVLEQTIAITITSDALFESNETFSVILSSPTNATIAVGTGTVTILDDEAAPGLAVGDATVTEGSTGFPTVSVPVTLSGASSTAVTVSFSTVDGTATVADGDYATTTGTLTFAPGETSKQILVSIGGDARVEPNETFLVRLADATGAPITRPDGTVTIADDDVAEAGPPEAGARPGDAGTPPGLDAGTIEAGAFTFTLPKGGEDDGCSTGGRGPGLFVWLAPFALLYRLRRRRPAGV